MASTITTTPPMATNEMFGDIILFSVTSQMKIFWDSAKCSLVEVDRSFRALMMGVVRISESSIDFYETTPHNIPGDCHLHTRRRENLKSHTIDITYE
jgi:hypothetical protein